MTVHSNAKVTQHRRYKLVKKFTPLTRLRYSPVQISSMHNESLINFVRVTYHTVYWRLCCSL